MSSPNPPVKPEDRARYEPPVLRLQGDIRAHTLGGSAGVVDSLNINTLQN